MTGSRLLPRDMLRVGAAGLRTRPLRVLLAALGIAIGIGAMVCVVGVASSSRAGLDRRLDRLGTNLLRVSPGEDLRGDAAELPVTSIPMIARIPPVRSVTAVAVLPQARVYRTDRVPGGESGNLSVFAARTDLPGTVGASLAGGTWLNAATERLPVVVLGSTAALRLGIAPDAAGTRIWLGDRWFAVAGVLRPVELAPELDFGALVGWPVAEDRLHFDGHPTTVYTRVRDDAVTAVAGVLAATADPSAPNQVTVSRPSDALAAREAADATLGGVLLGLGAVALLVGGIGVANTMVISILERRAEIGLRRALGATRGHVRVQFLIESQLLAALGGAGGVLLGIVLTAGYASYQGWPAVVPLWATGGAIAATLAIGALAGVYPAWRAARLSPTEALGAP